ncbi:hypothetical protein ACG2DA_21100, partial [Alienimonas sp. DA493]
QSPDAARVAEERRAEERRAANDRRVAAAEPPAAPAASARGSFADSRPETADAGPSARPAPLDSFVPYERLAGRQD